MNNMKKNLNIQIENINSCYEKNKELIPLIARTIKAYSPNNIILIGYDSDYNVARFAKYLIEIYYKIPVSIASPSVYLEYDSNMIMNKTLAIAFSSSGYDDNIKNILKEFENTKIAAIKAKETHKESKAKYEALVAEINPKMEAVKKEMLALEGSINEKLLAKYKAVKRDNVYPVFVTLNNGNCGGCRMMIPMGKVNKIKTDGYIVCEHCGRVIYIK
jgi:fructoselysine-6-P-deglycase FrlB-like protein